MMKLSTRKIVVAGMLGAVSIVLGLSGLGLIPVPTVAGKVTIMHVPVILGTVLEGPLVGGLIGLIFGIFSFLQATNAIFADPLVAILPRILIALVTYFFFLMGKRFNINLAYIIAGITGSLTNTVLALGLAVLRGYLPLEAAVSVGAIHGIPEAVVAAILVLIIGRALSKYLVEEKKVTVDP
ncbi:MAG TPA: ECF transporter S component [Halanaerobiales bacterium]|nr:ECF transporter S component [Halanaerobiales bacterium]